MKKQYNYSEKIYIIRAYLLPIEEFAYAINLADTAKPRIDEIKFIKSLVLKYNADEQDIFNRIREIRGMSLLLSQEKK